MSIITSLSIQVRQLKYSKTEAQPVDRMKVWVLYYANILENVIVLSYVQNSGHTKRLLPRCILLHRH
jgi:hypothetical protein